MKTYIKYLFLGIALVGFASCTKIDPAEKATELSCTEDTQCLPAAPVCNVTAGTCAECLAGKPGVCGGMEPVCGLDNACRACSAHNDCPSDACLPDGSCALDTEVIYLKGGVLSLTCSFGAPCSNLDTAIDLISATRRYLRVIGTVATDGVIAGKTVTILGEADSVLRGEAGGSTEPVLDIRNGSKVTVYDMQISNSRREGVRLDGADASLTLIRSKISQAPEEGIVVVNGGTLSLQQSQITNVSKEGILVTNGKASLAESEVSSCGTTTSRKGIVLTSGELTISRSKISNNAGGGISVANMQVFQISNSFIVGNRADGGLSIPKPGAGSKLEFNTIVDNQDGAGAGDAGGVTCDDSAFAFSNNIIFRNTGGNPTNPQTFGNCTYGKSYVAAGTGPSDASLAFKSNSSPFDYHLTAASPLSVKDVTGTACTDLTDFDGDARPQGSACDLGADEVK